MLHAGHQFDTTDTRTAGARGYDSAPDVDFIHVAPAPVLAGFDRLDQRMARHVEMLGGVFVFRRVATADVSACEAHAQVHPATADAQAVFASLAGRGDGVDLVEVRTGRGHAVFLERRPPPVASPCC